MAKRKKVGASKGHQTPVRIRVGKCEAMLVQVPGDDEVQFGFAGGKMARIDQIGLKVAHDDLVDGLENLERFGEMIAKVGLLVVSRLVGYNIAYGPDGLPLALAKWAGIDLEALKKEADLIEALENAAKIKRSSAAEEVFTSLDSPPIETAEVMQEKAANES